MHQCKESFGNNATMQNVSIFLIMTRHVLDSLDVEMNVYVPITVFTSSFILQHKGNVQLRNCLLKMAP